MDLDNDDAVKEWIKEASRERTAKSQARKRRREEARETLRAMRHDFVLNLDEDAASDILRSTRLLLDSFIASSILPHGQRRTYYINPYALPKMPQYVRFAEAHKKVKDKTIQLCYHGTPEENIVDILRNGLDPNRRKYQAHGIGEYFGATNKVSEAYCNGGKYLIIFAILLDPSAVEHLGVHSDLGGKIFVINKSSHQLPIGVIALKADTPTWSPPADFHSS